MTAARNSPSGQVPLGYKQTEVGVIPEDWNSFALNTLGKFKNGLNKDSGSFGHGSPFVNLMDVFGVNSIDSTSELGLVASTKIDREIYDLKSGDVLFIRSSVKPSGVGLTAVVTKDLQNAVFSGFLIRFRDNGAITNRFKKYCFYQEGFRNRVIAASSVSANTNINQSNLGLIKIPLPPTKAEQEAIAEALSDADALIESLEQLIAKKRQIKQGAMQELLTGKKRLPGFSGEWEETTLGSLGVFAKGSGVRKHEANSGNLPCVRYGEIYTLHDDYVKAYSSYISTEVALTAKLLRKGDLLFAGSGETREEIGKCVAFLDDIEAYAGGDIVILRPEGVDSQFFGYFLNTPEIVDQKASKGQGDDVVHISAKALASIAITIPDVTEQTAIATILSDMDAEIAALESKLAKARQVKQGMMQELLTGKTRLV